MPRTSAAHRKLVTSSIEKLRLLTDLFAERRRALAKSVGLTEPQWRLLEEIAGDDFMPSLFARRSQAAPAAVSRTLRQLLERGLVSVAIAQGDGRQRVYRLTDDGRSICERLGDQRERALAEIWDRVPTEELRAFDRVAGDLNRALSDYIEAGG